MEKREHKVSLDGPLVHWVKVLILKITMSSLHNANKRIYKRGKEAIIERDLKTAEVIDEAMKNNNESLIKAAELIQIAKVHIPIEWQHWPSLN